MGLSVQTNMAALSAVRNLGINNTLMNSAMQRLSTGFRINSASDNASGFAIASKLGAESAALKVAGQNVSEATAMVKMADAAVNQIQNMLVRIKTLATQAASGNNANNIAKLEAERVSLENAITKVASSTQYNGTYLLTGTGTTALLGPAVAGVAPAAPATATVSIQAGVGTSAANQVAVDLSGDYSAIGMGLTGSATPVFTTTAAANTYITQVDTALNTLLTNRAKLGAAVNQLSYVGQNLASSVQQNKSSVSAIKDADMAAEMANFTRGKILVQAGTSMLAQANQTSQYVLKLFR